jgi:uncharacterized protein (TIGR02001 family)
VQVGWSVIQHGALHRRRRRDFSFNLLIKNNKQTWHGGCFGMVAISMLSILERGNYMKKHILASALLAALVLPLGAQAEEASPLTGNFGVFSNYVFRGVTQTSSKPAIQGGFDYASPIGLYVGVWGSNVSWLSDGGYGVGTSLELDVYGGYKGKFGKSDFGYDVGAIVYYYPGKETATVNCNTATTRCYANLGSTAEIYGGLSWDWLTAKVSYAVSDYFGTVDSKGTLYGDLSASIPVGKSGVTVLAHVGLLKMNGRSEGACVYVPGPGLVLGTTCRNDDAYGYFDWKLGASYALPKDFTIGGYYTNTTAIAASYTYLNRQWSENQWVAYVQKTF